MSLYKLRDDLKKIQNKALNEIIKYPKDKELQKLTKLLTEAIKIIENSIAKVKR